MAQKTNLNAAPYFDDFDVDNNYHRILFRPGYAVQARELTQLQSALQHQIEAHGSHLFREGAAVVPGNGTIQRYYSLKLLSTFGTKEIDPSQYYNASTPVKITGATTGVTAKVIGYAAATTTEQPLLYLSYERAGSNFTTTVFADGENISANTAITHSTQAFATNVVSATTYTSVYSETSGATATQLASAAGPASRTGLAYAIESGIYYIRGFFVNSLAETLVLNSYTEDYTGTVGFDVTETIVTPEAQTSLLDNATGSSNYAAKGAHRLSITVALTKLTSTTNTTDFVNLIDIKDGKSRSVGRRTDYAQIASEFARRTNDESGSYTVRPFTFSLEESVDTTVQGAIFSGRYAVGAKTEDANTASSSKLALIVSPGKAYVKGYEIEKTDITIKDINKARDSLTVNAGISTFDLGNYAFITNVYGSPDITNISGESTPFKVVYFYDELNTTRGTANGNIIGVGRARGMEYYSGTAGATLTNTSSKYKLYLFDVNPFVKLTLSGTPSPTLLATHANGGVQVTGVTSLASGFVFSSGTTSTNVNLTNVVGTFQVGESIKASDSSETGGIVENSSNADLTISAVRTYSFADFKQVYMDDDDSGQDFTANFVTETAKNIFARITLENDVASFIELETATDSGTIIQEGFDTSIAVLKDTDLNQVIFTLPKAVIKTLLTTSNAGVSDTQYTLRRQFIGTTNSSGVVSFTAGSNETFSSHSEADYTMSILTAGTGTGVQGDLVSLSGKIGGAGTVSLTVTDNTILANGAKVKLIASLLKTAVTQKNKTTKLMKQLKVVSGTTDAFGTRPTDKTISLGRADAFAVVGVFDSESSSTDAVAPEMTLTNVVGTFERGEEITGGTSDAKARIIDISTPMNYVEITSLSFVTGEKITGTHTGATATVGTLTVGSVGVGYKYVFDAGQRENFYDISRLIRNNSEPAPTGRLLIVYDYFEHGTGDLLTVDSYSDVSGQMQYDDIPSDLLSAYDFRPKIVDVAGSSTTLETVDEITGNSFDFYTHQFSGTGATTVDVCKPGSTVQSDFEYYLGKIVSLVINDRGAISVIEGVSSESPQRPDVPDDVMKLAYINLNPYTFSTFHASIDRVKNQRFTMKDIGQIESRLSNVEKVTTLNLLEANAAEFEVLDANGLNRFKSGFVVDSFHGHVVGDVLNADYRNSMDFVGGMLRPTHVSKSVDLEESVSTTAARKSAGYQKTGDLITLPYTQAVLTEQPFASTVERVAPFLTATWKGTVSLDPTQDNWMETEIAPDLIVNTEGNYSAVVTSIGNNMGVVWNSWQTTWQGTVQRDDGLAKVAPQVRPFGGAGGYGGGQAAPAPAAPGAGMAAGVGKDILSEYYLVIEETDDA